MPKPWLDVGTTSTPRLTTRGCMQSFFDKFTDRDNYRLRWVFHLDQHYDPGLEENWDAEFDQAVLVSELFDDALLMASRTNQSYGGSLYRVMNEAKRDMLYVEGDKRWLSEFSVAEALKADADVYYYHPTILGMATPAYWSYAAIRWYMEHFPPNHRQVCERALGELFVGQDAVTCAAADSRPWKDIGLNAYGHFKVGKRSVAKGARDVKTGEWRQTRNGDEALRMAREPVVADAEMVDRTERAG